MSDERIRTSYSDSGNIGAYYDRWPRPEDWSHDQSIYDGIHSARWRAGVPSHGHSGGRSHPIFITLWVLAGFAAAYWWVWR